MSYCSPTDELGVLLPNFSFFPVRNKKNKKMFKRKEWKERERERSAVLCLTAGGGFSFLISFSRLFGVEEEEGGLNLYLYILPSRNQKQQFSHVKEEITPKISFHPKSIHRFFLFCFFFSFTFWTSPLIPVRFDLSNWSAQTTRCFTWSPGVLGLFVCVCVCARSCCVGVSCTMPTIFMGADVWCVSLSLHIRHGCIQEEEEEKKCDERLSEVMKWSQSENAEDLNLSSI